MIMLITGSRDWVDVREIRECIRDAYERSGPPGHRYLVVRHGACPTGADRIASLIVYAYHQQGIYTVMEDPMPADWNRKCDSQCVHYPRHRPDGTEYCPIAGLLRNQAMIDKGGIAEVHAFPLKGGKGTQDCMRRAQAAGLPVTVHEQHLEAAHVGATQPV